MLCELHIRDFAIIDSLELVFHPGFIVLTGETGAGKSIIIDAVGLLLGGRAETTAIRSGAQSAIIEGHFRLEPSIREAVDAILESEGLLEDPQFLTLGREIRREGRNFCRVNGRAVNLSLLRKLGEHLIDVHGQSEHLSLFRVSEHISLLDRYAQLEDLRHKFRRSFQELSQVRHRLAELLQRERHAAGRAELLLFQINEIEAAALRRGEIETLIEERTRLANAEKLTRLIGQAIAALDESTHSDRSAIDRLGEVVEALNGLASIDSSMNPIRTEAQAQLEQLTDLAGELRGYGEQIEFNPKRLDEVQERMAMIRSLERKYGGSIDAVLAHRKKAGEELGLITSAEQQIQILRRREEELLSQLGKLGSRLSKARQEATTRLSTAIETELAGLHMAEARFRTRLLHREDENGIPIDNRRLAFNPNGIDQAEFMVEPNPGEGLKPLAKIASGGESSRLMLGLKTVLAQADRTPTLIFDEIDQGIGGRVGSLVGYKLWCLGREHQVLCVTHLPQLAAFGDQHYRIEKKIKAGRTITTAKHLSGEDQREELAQMLGGVSQSNLQSASDLLEKASKAKSEARSKSAETI